MLRFLRHTNNQVRQVTAQSVTDFVQLLKADPLGNLVVQFADRVGAYAGLACKVRLGPPQFTKPGG